MKDLELYDEIIAKNPAIDVGLRWLTLCAEKTLFKMIVCAAYRQGQVDKINEDILKLDRKAG